jgi:membrane protein implicated in regulation of membrane protease activity
MDETVDSELVSRLTAYLDRYATYPRPAPPAPRRTSPLEVVVVTLATAAAVVAVVLAFTLVHWGIAQAPGGHITPPAPVSPSAGFGFGWLIWLVVAVVLVAAEIHTQAYYALFLAAGAAVAAIVSATAAPLVAQAVVGGGAAIAGVFLIRPRLRRLMEEGRTVPYRYPGMAGGLVGQRAMTLDRVGDDRHPGHAMLAKERWLAITDAAEPLPPGVEVVVAAVRGTTLLVRPRSRAQSVPSPSELGDSVQEELKR